MVDAADGRLSAGDRGLERGDCKAGINAAANGITDDASRPGELDVNCDLDQLASNASAACSEAIERRS